MERVGCRLDICWLCVRQKVTDDSIGQQGTEAGVERLKMSEKRTPEQDRKFWRREGIGGEYPLSDMIFWKMSAVNTAT